MRKLERTESFYEILIGRGRFIKVLALLILFNCKVPEPEAIKTQKYFSLDSIYTDYLVSFSEEGAFTPGASYGYRNSKGEIIIPVGKYNHCFTDTFRNFAYVSDEKLTNSKIVAIDRNEKILFDVYMFDNGPDYLADGLFRIVRNGKIGYADKNGIIIIEPKYECAEPFVQDIAKVTYECRKSEEENGLEHSNYESNSWFFIDKLGSRIK